MVSRLWKATRPLHIRRGLKRPFQLSYSTRTLPHFSQTSSSNVSLNREMLPIRSTGSIWPSRNIRVAKHSLTYRTRTMQGLEMGPSKGRSSMDIWSPRWHRKTTECSYVVGRPHIGRVGLKAGMMHMGSVGNKSDMTHMSKVSIKAGMTHLRLHVPFHILNCNDASVCGFGDRKSV